MQGPDSLASNFLECSMAKQLPTTVPVDNNSILILLNIKEEKKLPTALSVENYSIFFPKQILGKS